MQEFILWLRSFWWVTLIGGSCLIEIAPVKVNPLSAILKWIGKKINAETLERIDGLEKNMDQNEIDRIRYEVLNFATSCRQDVMHTQDEFEHIIALNGKYTRLLKKHDKENGVFEAEYAYILELYRERQRKNDFV